ncbi:exonuclease domain-containing protein [Streptomyces sp. A3M-1-3]|uniref:exonuclease domain-containing protein n=1 Tax=Streptomyces sp. A3M-1-3 TaxID=2962044 RepID=UPI0020B7C345|nr:exonuclease domain-containing protein [Streptomyces sp. A3M-1-3]MCP3817799.1 exonuclease domain-containing protein [Streptomyces sp. A3M-1-3]
MSWHLKRMAAFDLETTSVDPETARIVTACIVQVGGGQPPQPANWVADPGVEIPEEAAKIHGYTTERARTEGRPAIEVIEEITAALGWILAHGIPIVAMNARYDLTVLDRECRRRGLPTLSDRYVDDVLWPVIDPFVIDKQVDRYRRGKRNLTALCEHYKVKLDGAHDSAADAIAAARVAWRLGATRPELAAMDIEALHHAQIKWAAEQAASLQAHFRKTDPQAYCAPEWPLIPHQRRES